MRKILVIDDHPIILAACRSLLEGSGNTTVFEAADPQGGYEAFLRHEPDVVVLDLRLQGQDLAGLAFIERMRSREPNVAILVFSMHSDPHVIAAAIKAGATGYISKDAPPEELLGAVEQVRSGLRYLDQELALRLALLETEAASSANAVFAPREQQVLALLAQGKSYSAVAHELGISYKTIINITYRLRKKLNAKGLPDLIRKAMELTRLKS